MSPFPKAGAYLGPIARSLRKPQQRLLQHYKLAKFIGVHQNTAVSLNVSVDQCDIKLLSPVKHLLHFVMSKKSSGKLKYWYLFPFHFLLSCKEKKEVKSY